MVSMLIGAMVIIGSAFLVIVYVEKRRMSREYQAFSRQVEARIQAGLRQPSLSSEFGRNVHAWRLKLEEIENRDKPRTLP